MTDEIQTMPHGFFLPLDAPATAAPSRTVHYYRDIGDPDVRTVDYPSVEAAHAAILHHERPGRRDPDAWYVDAIRTVVADADSLIWPVVDQSAYYELAVMLDHDTAASVGYWHPEDPDLPLGAADPRAGAFTATLHTADRHYDVLHPHSTEQAALSAAVRLYADARDYADFLDSLDTVALSAELDAHLAESALEHAIEAEFEPGCLGVFRLAAAAKETARASLRPSDFNPPPDRHDDERNLEVAARRAVRYALQFVLFGPPTATGDACNPCGGTGEDCMQSGPCTTCHGTGAAG